MIQERQPDTLQANLIMPDRATSSHQSSGLLNHPATGAAHVSANGAVNAFTADGPVQRTIPKVPLTAEVAGGAAECGATL